MRGMQLAIEIIFIILVMLVVSIVAIQLFSKTIKKAGTIARTSGQQVYAQCQQICSTGNIFQFCTAFVSGDLNGDGALTFINYKGTGKYICEKNIYCPDLITCNFNGMNYGVLECAKYLCSYEENNAYLNSLEATKEVFGEYINGRIQPFILKIGVCGPNDIPSWYKRGLILRLGELAKTYIGPKYEVGWLKLANMKGYIIVVFNSTKLSNAIKNNKLKCTINNNGPLGLPMITCKDKAITYSVLENNYGVYDACDFLLYKYPS